MLRKVYLEGEIADRFGSEFEMEVNSFADVMSCLNANFDDFRQYITVYMIHIKLQNNG